jgi:hypothetical protein
MAPSVLKTLCSELWFQMTSLTIYRDSCATQPWRGISRYRIGWFCVTTGAPTIKIGA